MAEAVMRVSLELLRELLHLPDGTYIHDVDGSWSDGFVELTVSHPDIPNRSPIGDTKPWPPVVSPTWMKQPEVVFLGWNIKD